MSGGFEMHAESMDSRALDQLDELAKAEYGTTFAAALEGQSEEMFVKRLARLSGIPLKEPFSRPVPTDGRSETNALRYWELTLDMQKEVRRLHGPYPLLEGLRARGDPAYSLAEEMAKIRQAAETVTMDQVADTINNAQQESNWFTNLVLVIRRRLCKPGKQNEIVLEGIKKAADEIANKGVEYALTAIIEPLAAKLIAALPVLQFVPHVAAIGATYFIVKYASRSFCTAEIAPQFTTLFDITYEYR
jgi:hypothetical protein